LTLIGKNPLNPVISHGTPFAYIHKKQKEAKMANIRAVIDNAIESFLNTIFTIEFIAFD